MSNSTHEKVVIIGAGAAGLTAAIYTARANLSPVILAGLQPGGQMTITTDVENYPGFAEVIQGPWLMTEMQQQAENVGARVVYDIVTALDASSRPFRLTLDSGDRMTADAVIVATGAQARWLGLESEQAFNGRGVSACATCDGFFFKNKHVYVVGGGDTACEEATFLTKYASKVSMVVRRDQMRASKIMQERALNHEKVEVLWETQVTDVLDVEKGRVTGLELTSTKTGDKRTVDADGLFLAIGHKPNTGLFEGVLDMDDVGYLKTQPGKTAMNIPGVFAAGDCQDSYYRQAVTAAGTGCMAAIEAERWLEDQHG